MAAHVRDGDPMSAFLVFCRMRRRGAIPLDSFAFTPLLAALPQLGPELHSLMTKIGCLSGQPVPSTALLNAYSNCGRCDDAVALFRDMGEKRDLVSWNALISCFVRHGRAADAISSFRAMVEERVAFNGVTLCTVLKALYESPYALWRGKQIHAQVIVSCSDSLVLTTALVGLYSSCGVMADALEVFDRSKCHRDDVIYNSLISGLVQSSQYEEAFSFLRKMKPNMVALTCALAASSDTLNLQYGRQIHCQAIVCGFHSDTILCNALVDMYAKCGETAVAYLVFDRIGAKNVVSWSSIIDAYGSHGCGLEAMKLFKRMMEEEGSTGILPNAVTFLSVLSACSHSGLVDEGREVFYSMREEHGIDPGPKHYACFIDLLGRAGKTEEAWQLYCCIRASDDKLTSAVCVAMLNASRVGMDLERGQSVMRDLLELDPQNPGCYVLLSNFFAAIGEWKGAEDFRRVISRRGLRKEVGSSSLTLEDRL